MRGGPVVNAPKKTVEQKKEEERAVKIQVHFFSLLITFLIDRMQKKEF